MYRLQSANVSLRIAVSAAMTVCLFAAVVGVVNRSLDPAMAAVVDGGSVEMGLEWTSEVAIPYDGFAQGFIAPVLGGSPACNAGSQKVLIRGVQVMMEAAGDEECIRHGSDVFVSVRESRNGDDIAIARLYYDYPSSGIVEVKFDAGVQIDVGDTYYLVVAHRPGSIDYREGHHWLRGVLEAASIPVSSTHELPDIGMTGLDESGSVCTASGPAFSPLASLALDSGDPYEGGESDISGSDIVGRIDYTYVIESKVLALYYDPIVGEVSFSDMIGPIAPYDYGDADLTEVLSPFGWRPGGETAEQLASDIETVTEGVVDIVLVEHTLNEWPTVVDGSAKWYDDVGMLGEMEPFSGWTGWTNDTWPCWPHIPVSEVMGGAERNRRSCYPSTTGRFDYTSLFGRVIEDTSTLADLVNSGEIDDVWIFADPTSGLHPAVLVVPETDAGYELMAPAIQMPGLTKRVAVMGFNHDRDEVTALRLYAHRAEQALAAVWNGNLYPSCAVNALDASRFNEFTRIHECTLLYATGTPEPGSVGRVMLSPNAAGMDPDAVIDPYRRPLDETPAANDADKWLYYPDEPPVETEVSLTCQWWGCSEYGYYMWWLGHIPVAGGFDGETYNNLWPYIVQPACFAEVGSARYDPTPAATP